MAGVQAGQSGVKFLSGARDFSLLQHVHTGSGTHLASYLIGSVGFFLGLQQQGCEAVHLPPFSAEELKNGWSDKFPVCICDSDMDNIIYIMYLARFFQNGSIFLGMFTKFWKVTVSFVMSIHPLVRMELLSCHWTDFHEI